MIVEYTILPSGHAMTEIDGIKRYYWGEKHIEQWALHFNPDKPTLKRI